MLIRMGLNYAVHAAAGVATAGVLILAAEGWRRAYKAGNGPRMASGGRRDDDDAVARHDWIDEEAEGAPSSGGPASGGPSTGQSGGAGPSGSGPAGSGPGAAGA
jgi:hypothetical protein